MLVKEFNMILLQQHGPNCLIYAFAMVTEIDPKNLIRIIGHNGMELVWPDSKIPYCYRNFHIQELIDAVNHFGFIVMEIQRIPVTGNNQDKKLFYPYLNPNERFKKYLDKYEGVLVSNFHAYGWDRQFVYDSRICMKYPINIDDYTFFFAVIKST